MTSGKVVLSVGIKKQRRNNMKNFEIVKWENLIIGKLYLVKDRIEGADYSDFENYENLFTYRLAEYCGMNEDGLPIFRQENEDVYDALCHCPPRYIYDAEEVYKYLEKKFEWLKSRRRCTAE